MPSAFFNYANPGGEVFQDDAAILADLRDDEWAELLAMMERRRFPAEAAIVEAGDSDRTLYLIASGSVRIVLETRAGRRHVATIGEGSVFGEMAFFDGSPGTANVMAEEEVEVLALTLTRFEQLAAWHPRIAFKLLMDLGRVLSRRLRQLNQSQ